MRWSVCFWILSLLLSACATHGARQPAGESPGPTAEVFRLHSGRKILLPKRSDNLDYVFLLGNGDLEALNKILAREDLVAVPGSGGRGTLGVIIAKYNSSSLGAYQEVLVVISAQPKSPKDSGAFAGNMPMPGESAPPPTPYYVWSQQINLPLAADVGREVWGLPATPGVIDLATAAPDWTFSLNSRSKGLIFEGKCGNCGIAGKQNLGAGFTLISGYGLRRSLIHVENFGPTLVRPFDAKVDAFNLKPKSPLAILFRRVGFQPYGWFVGEKLSASQF